MTMSKGKEGVSKSGVPHDPRTRLSDILPSWLKKTFGRGASKKIQDCLDVSRYVADQALAGQVSLDTLMAMIAVWKDPFINEVIKQVIDVDQGNDNILKKFKNLEVKVTYLRRQIEELSMQAQEVGLFDDNYPVEFEKRKYPETKTEIKQAFIDLSKIINKIVPTDIGKLQKGFVDDLKIFSGTVLMNEELDIDSASAEHAKLLRAYKESNGYFTETFANELMVSGIGHRASIYDEDIKVRRIGDGTVFWTEEQRRAVIGRSIWEITAPKEYVSLVYNALSTSVLEKKPKLHLVGFRAGGNEAFYDRITFHFRHSGLVVASPLPRKLITS